MHVYKDFINCTTEYEKLLEWSHILTLRMWNRYTLTIKWLWPIKCPWSDKPHLGWFFLNILLFFISVVFHNPFIDTLQPQSLTVQVSRSLCCPRRAQSYRKCLTKQSELSVTLYSLCQAGRKGIKRFVYLCVDLNWGCVGIFSWQRKMYSWDVKYLDSYTSFVLQTLLRNNIMDITLSAQS